MIVSVKMAGQCPQGCMYRQKLVNCMIF